MSKRAIKSGYESMEIEVVGDITYIGLSTIGTSEAVEKWIVKKIEVVGDLTSITFGEGSWADRATLTYL